MEALSRYSWPGNVRELRNTVERAMILAPGPKLRIDVPSGDPLPAARQLRMEDAERSHVLSILEMSGWRIRGKGGAAEILDMNPTTLESRMARLGIRRR